MPNGGPYRRVLHPQSAAGGHPVPAGTAHHRDRHPPVPVGEPGPVPRVCLQLPPGAALHSDDHHHGHRRIS